MRPDEIQFDCSMRVVQGDKYHPNLANHMSPIYRTKSEIYRRLVSFR